LHLFPVLHPGQCDIDDFNYVEYVDASILELCWKQKCLVENGRKRVFLHGIGKCFIMLCPLEFLILHYRCCRASEERKSSVETSTIGVQTEDTSFIFPVESSSWLNQGSVDSYQPLQNKWQTRSDVDSVNIGIHSVPTVIHKQKLAVDSDSIGSVSESDVKSIRSHNYALPSKKPNNSRADFIAKTRQLAPFSSDFYSSSDNYRLPENVGLPPSRRVNKIKNKPETSLSLDDSTFNNIKISGKKFSAPIILPKLVPTPPSNNHLEM
jgi:hypothetical protein